jgi:hypothetical protein
MFGILRIAVEFNDELGWSSLGLEKRSNDLDAYRIPLTLVAIKCNRTVILTYCKSHLLYILTIRCDLRLLGDRSTLSIVC